jgi:hypothetical protein
MLFYYAKSFKASIMGSRLKEATCELCSFVYYYNLTRYGFGTATAHYGIGEEKAPQKAEEAARRDLQKRLEIEAELVPCPKCRWVGESLIVGYRRGRYRKWGRAAFFLGSLGIILSLLAAWIVPFCFPVDQTTILLILILGSVSSITLAMMVLALRGLLRRLIQPNRNYPDVTKLPRGVPDALLIDPTTGELEVARREKAFHEEDDPIVKWYDFQLGRNVMPDTCCVCLNPSDQDSSYRHSVLPAIKTAIPFCHKCAGSWKKRRFRLLFAVIATSTMLWFSFGGYFKQDNVISCCEMIILFVASPAAFAVVMLKFSAPYRIKLIDSPRAIIRLRFSNAEFVNVIKLYNDALL